MNTREMKDFLEALCRRLARRVLVAPCAAGLIAGGYAGAGAALGLGLPGCADGAHRETEPAATAGDDGGVDAAGGELYGAPPVEDCADGEDNDGDGRIDEADPDCAGEVVAMYTAPGCTLASPTPSAEAVANRWADVVHIVARRHRFGKLAD